MMKSVMKSVMNREVHEAIHRESLAERVANPAEGLHLELAEQGANACVGARQASGPGAQPRPNIAA